MRNMRSGHSIGNETLPSVRYKRAHCIQMTSYLQHVTTLGRAADWIEYKTV